MIDVSNFALTVSAGDILAIVLRTESTLPGAYDWMGTNDLSTDFYPRGNSFASSDNGATWQPFSRNDFQFWTYVEPAVWVDVDIRPGSETNRINPRSRGRVQVAIVTTDDFDASTINLNSVRFGPRAAQPICNPKDTACYRLHDVDADGDQDLVVTFDVEETGILCGDTEVTLTGHTFDGVAILGRAAIETVGCNK